MDEKVKEICKLFQDSFTKSLMLFENPNMGGNSYGLAMIELRNAYRKLPTLLSLLEKKDKEIEHWKGDWQKLNKHMEGKLNLLIEKDQRIKELEQYIHTRRKGEEL